MAPEAAVPAGDDLTIRVVSRRLVRASDDTIQPHVAAVSNLDLYFNTNQACMVCLYPKLPVAITGSFDAVVATFEVGLPSLLNHFYPLAGRIVVDPVSGLPELHCHNQGAELVVGEVDAALGALDFAGIDGSLRRIMLPYPNDVMLSVQLLRFACGGFSVVWGNNHLPNDGHGISMVVRMWSELARTGKIADGTVNHDRSVFQPRSPPLYGAAVSATFTAYDDSRLVNVLNGGSRNLDSFVERLYHIDAGDVARLSDMASTEQLRSSRVQAVSAFLWKALAGVVAASRVPEEWCQMGWWVDARRRVTSPALLPAMHNFFGNMTTYALGEAAVEEILEKLLAKVAAMVWEAIASIDYDSYVQEMVDWVEEHKTERTIVVGSLGLGSPMVNKTVFASFPLDTDFGFGHATLAMPVWENGRVNSGTLVVGARLGGDGSWLVSAYVWWWLAAALESDDHGIFKSLTAAYLGLV